LENIEARERTKQTKTPTKVVNRQKILLGAYVLEKQPQIAKSAEFKVWLTRDGDRAVFGLEPLAKETAQ
jgi:alpha-tubulin suppressor-like RCC1 family protein